MQRLYWLIGNKIFIIGLALVMILLTNVFYYFMLPPNYGWWQVYAFLIESGMVLYNDLNLAFTPLFITFHVFLRHLGGNVFVSITAGLFMMLSIWGLLYLVLRTKFSVFVSTVSALVPLLIWSSSGHYIPDDYHTFVNLFAVSAFYFYYISTTVESTRVYKIPSAILCAFFVVVVFYTKQNIGLLIMVFAFVGYLYYGIRKPRGYWLSIYYSAAILIFFVVFKSWLSLSTSDVFALTIYNDAKGGALTIFTNVFTRTDNLKTLVFSSAIYFMLWVAYIVRQDILQFAQWILSGFRSSHWVANPTSLSTLKLALSFLALPVLIFFYKYIGHALIIMSCVFLYYIFITKVLRGEPDGSYFFFLFGQVFSSTLTAGFDVVNIYIVSSLALGHILSKTEESLNSTDMLLSSHFHLLVFSSVLVLFSLVFYQKSIRPYNWWSMQQSNVFYSKYDLPYPELQGIKVGYSTSSFYLTVKNVIDTYSVSNDDVYLYPHIPIFYLLHSKIPPTPNLVQWFDVISTKNMEQEVLSLKRNPPKVVIIMDPPSSVYDAHEEMRRQPLLQHQLLLYFERLRANGLYDLISYKTFDADRQQYTKRLFNLKKNIIVNNRLIVGASIDDLYESGRLGARGFIRQLHRNSVAMNSPVSIEKVGLKLNDVISVEGDVDFIDELSSVLGEPQFISTYPFDKYVLKIYIRRDP